MLAERQEERTRPDTKSAKMRDLYRTILRTPGLSDQEISHMRENVRRLARTLCEHVWDKPFY